MDATHPMEEKTPPLSSTSQLEVNVVERSSDADADDVPNLILESQRNASRSAFALESTSTIPSPTPIMPTDLSAASVEPISPTLYEVQVSAFVYDSDHIVVRTVPSRTLILCNARKQHVDQTFVRLPEGTWIRQENLRLVYEFVVEPAFDKL